MPKSAKPSDKPLQSKRHQLTLADHATLLIASQDHGPPPHPVIPATASVEQGLEVARPLPIRQTDRSAMVALASDPAAGPTHQADRSVRNTLNTQTARPAQKDQKERLTRKERKAPSVLTDLQTDRVQIATKPLKNHGALLARIPQVPHSIPMKEDTRHSPPALGVWSMC